MRIPQVGDYIKHETNKDVAILINGVVLNDLQDLLIKGVWVNQGFDNTYMIGHAIEHTISSKVIGNWLICENPKAKCIRHEKWSPLA